jgi:hypothetical protein
MPFTYSSSKLGYMPACEYFPAPAGDYITGQLANLAAGKIAPLSAASTTTPDLVIMYTGTITADDVTNRTGSSAELASGDVIAVARIANDSIYEVELATAIASLAPGVLASVASGGLTLQAAAGTFEVLSVGGTGTGAIGDNVTGRFTTVAGN